MGAQEAPKARTDASTTLHISVTATNAVGTSAESARSNEVVPKR